MNDLKTVDVCMADDVLFQELGGEAVLVNTGNGRYFGLNELGARIWQGLSAGDSMTKMLTAVLAEYDVVEDRLVADVSNFLDALQEAGLVSVERLAG